MRRMITLAWMLVYILVFGALIGIAATKLFDWLRGDTTPLWEGAAMGVFLAVATTIGEYCRRRGWVWRAAPSRSDGIKQRKIQLAQERDQIMADALARKEAQGE